MHRAIIFTNSASYVPAILIRGTLAALTHRHDLELVAICVPEPQNFADKLCRYFMLRILFCIQSLFDPARKRHHVYPLPINLNRWARRFQFKVLVPPGGNINHPQFIARLRNEIRPTIALSFFCPQKFSQELLATFGDTVNYHNSLLQIGRASCRERV